MFRHKGNYKHCTLNENVIILFYYLCKIIWKWNGNKRYKWYTFMIMFKNEQQLSNIHFEKHIENESEKTLSGLWGFNKHRITVKTFFKVLCVTKSSLALNNSLHQYGKTIRLSYFLNFRELTWVVLDHFSGRAIQVHEERWVGFAFENTVFRGCLMLALFDSGQGSEEP